MSELTWYRPDDLKEWYGEDVSLPRDSLSRMAEKLRSRGSMYLGGGVGVELRKDQTYQVIGGAKHDGPLSAMTEALKLAGAKNQLGTPGGTATVSDPAIAARLFELDAEQADQESTIKRMQRNLVRNAKEPLLPYAGGLQSGDDTRWEARRIRECEERLKQIKKERRGLLAAKTEAQVKEALALGEETGKPGTNWKQVGPAERKKINPIVKHYMGMAHPFTACVRDNRKRFGDRAEKVCAVVKDMGERSTKWRKGGKAREEEFIQECMTRLLEAADGDVQALEAMMLAHILEAEVAAVVPFGQRAVPEAPENTPKARRKRKRAKQEAVLGRTTSGTTGDADATGVGVSEGVVFHA